MMHNIKYLLSVAISGIVALNTLTVSALPQLSFTVENAHEEMPVYKENQIDNVTVYSSTVEQSYSFGPELDFSVESIDDINIIHNDNRTSDIYDSGVSLFARAMFEGSGTAADPYIIATNVDLTIFSTCINSGQNDGMYLSAHYKLTSDIDYGGQEWTPVGTIDNPFSGVFDGNGHTISNLKITSSNSSAQHFYLGLFGLINNGSLKDLTVSDLTIDVHEFVTSTDDTDAINNIESNKETYVYVGGLAARFIAEGAETVSVINNCNVKNVFVDVSANFRMYGGGLIGFIHSSNGAEISITNCSAEATENYLINDTSYQLKADLANPSKDSIRSRIRAGGFIGYIGIVGTKVEEEYIPAKITITKSGSRADVITTFYDINSASQNNTHTGGFVGSIGLENICTLTISESYSSNTVYSYGDSDVYSGAFTGNVVCTDSTVNFNDTFSNTRVYVQCKTGESYTSGFASISAAQFKNSATAINYTNCYSASDMIIDLKDNATDSASGTFLTYYSSYNNLTNCYSVKDLIHEYGTAKLATALETKLEKSDASSLSNFRGFDSQVWSIGDGNYLYPTLINNEYKTGMYSVYEYKKNSTPISVKNNLAYGDEYAYPSKTPESYYIFSHWAIAPSGKEIQSTEKVSGTAVLFPMFTNEYVSFDISFFANGEVFNTTPMKYLSEVVFPACPNKPSDSNYIYEFSHWSLTENGDELTDVEKTVNGKCTYYAVYTKIPNAGWDGQTAIPFSKGNGTEENPYEIADGFQLYNLAIQVNTGNNTYADAYYTITRNIDLSGNEWMPIGTENNPFTGNLNGNGYSIYNFKIENPQTNHIGLFGYIDGADIYKLDVSGFEITFDTSDIVYIGAIAGYVNSGTSDSTTRIYECIADGSYLTNEAATANASALYAGGIAGYVNASPGYVYIENCFSTSEMILGGYDNSAPNTNYVFCGGIAGYFTSSSAYISGIDTCYFSGKIEAIAKTSGYAGGIVGFCENTNGFVGERSNAPTLYASSTTGDIRNCFVAAESISVSDAINAYAGHIYAYTGTSNTSKILNCASSQDTIISAESITLDSNIEIHDTKSQFTNDTYLAETLGLDFDNIWHKNDSKLPTHKAFNLVQSYFKLLKFEFDETEDALLITVSSCYRDLASYTVLVGIYDERGKMIGFKAVTVDNPTESQKFDINITGIPTADSCKLSVITSDTFELIEQTKSL